MKFTLWSSNLPPRKQNKITEAPLSLSLSLSLYIYIYTHTHTHTRTRARACVYVYVYIYIYICVCVCVYLLAQTPCYLLSLWRLYSNIITHTKFIPNLSSASLQTKPEIDNFSPIQQ